MRVSDVKLLQDRGYEIINNNKPGDSIIGEGAYSKVQLFYSAQLKKHVAIKIINKSSAPRDFVQHFLPREIEVLQRVRHPFIVEIYEILATNDGRVFIAMEYAMHGDLLKHIQQNGAIDEDRSRYLFEQLAKAILYLHKKHIVHRDLKCENLLLTKLHEDLPTINTHGASSCSESNDTMPESPRQYHHGASLPSKFDLDAVKLTVTDFGFSRRFDDDNDRSRTFCGSAAYAAPEIIKGEPYCLKDHDMWSLGVILFIMVCGTMPYDDSNVRKMLKDQLSRKLRFPPAAAQKLSKECKDLIHNLIEPNQRNRFNIEQVLNHAWLTRIANPNILPTPITITSLGLHHENTSQSDAASTGRQEFNQQHQDQLDGGGKTTSGRGGSSEERSESRKNPNKFWW